MPYKTNYKTNKQNGLIIKFQRKKKRERRKKNKQLFINFWPSKNGKGMLISKDELLKSKKKINNNKKNNVFQQRKQRKQISIIELKKIYIIRIENGKKICYFKDLK